MKAIKVEIPAAAAEELFGKSDSLSFDTKIHLVFDDEARKHYSKDPNLRGELVGVTNFRHFYLVIEL
jgi:hypothetical protein